MMTSRRTLCATTLAAAGLMATRAQAQTAPATGTGQIGAWIRAGRLFN